MPSLSIRHYTDYIRKLQKKNFFISFWPELSFAIHFAPQRFFFYQPSPDESRNLSQEERGKTFFLIIGGVRCHSNRRIHRAAYLYGLELAN